MHKRGGFDKLKRLQDYRVHMENSISFPRPDVLEYPYLKAWSHAVLQAWPQYESALKKTLDPRTSEQLALSESLAQIIDCYASTKRLEVCQGFRALCEDILNEELFFRREGHYRLSTEAQAAEHLYLNASAMMGHIHGLMLSQLLWNNHFCSYEYFSRNFLNSLPTQFSLLELGPGHGLLLAAALAHKNCASAQAWDISPTSIQVSRTLLTALGFDPMNVKEQGLFESDAQEFDALVLSEILEHVENPLLFLKTSLKHLKSGGRIYINIPTNAPAIDHIYLFRNPEEITKLVQEAGLTVEDAVHFPTTGVSLEKAKRLSLTLSCVVVGVKQ